MRALVLLVLASMVPGSSAVAKPADKALRRVLRLEGEAPGAFIEEGYIEVDYAPGSADRYLVALHVVTYALADGTLDVEGEVP